MMGNFDNILLPLLHNVEKTVPSTQKSTPVEDDFTRKIEFAQATFASICLPTGYDTCACNLDAHNDTVQPNPLF